jgi:hypothetical protein
MSIVPISIYVDPGADPEERWNIQGIAHGVTVKGSGESLNEAAEEFDSDLSDKLEVVEESGVDPS